ncbi:MAG: hypothetical protein LUF35_08125, partial [Lachnospiraceae bacterium]|nr:hypothetical protein [Lachnospiraceae bacterium]
MIHSVKPPIKIIGGCSEPEKHTSGQRTEKHQCPGPMPWSESYSECRLFFILSNRNSIMSNREIQAEIYNYSCFQQQMGSFPVYKTRENSLCFQRIYLDKIYKKESI